MNKKRERATELRRQGLSYKTISQELGIATSTLASWFKKEPWSQEIKNRLSLEVSWSNPKALESLVRANHERWKIIHEEYRNAAIIEFGKYKDDPLFLAGVMLYWGEGEKQHKYSAVRFANSDPEMIRLFNLFLTITLKISPDKISIWLLLYPDLVDSIQKNFWSRAAGLKPNQFKKSVYIKGRHPSKRLSYGVCNISINSRALKERMLKWIELCQNHLRSKATMLEK